MPLSVEHRATGRRSEHCATGRWRMFRVAPDWALTDMPRIVPLSSVHRAIGRWRMFRVAPDWALTDMPSVVPLSVVYRAIEGRCKHCAAASLTSCRYQSSIVLLVGVPSIVLLVDGECAVLLLIRC